MRAILFAVVAALALSMGSAAFAGGGSGGNGGSDAPWHGSSY